MLGIDAGQLEQLSTDAEERFVRDSVQFLRDARETWAEDRTGEQIAAFVRDMTAFAEAHDVVQTGNVRRLMLLSIDRPFQRPLDDYRKMRLTQNGFSEGRRMKVFAETLTGKPVPVRITLD